MITPHLPPQQAANALLPVMLGEALASRGFTTSYVAHPGRQESGSSAAAPKPGTRYVPRRGRTGFDRSAAGAIMAGTRMALGAAPAVWQSDIVHLHGNGLIIEVGELLARRFGKPFVITLYGTDVWYHDAQRHARFARVVRRAAYRAFYSRGLLEFARPLGLAADPAGVVYAPVSTAFRPLDDERRKALRRELGIGDEPLLVTVKRLHQVAGYETLLRALPDVLRLAPAAKVWLIGEGERRAALESMARELNLTSRVRFLGLLSHEEVSRYCAAADVFVLPSNLESWGTVMLEALACGTPVITTSTAGGMEVHEHFPEDVTVVQIGDAAALAAAIERAIGARRRVSKIADERLRTEFSVSRCADRYEAIYRQALA
jgi:glycosyltransferase involved in cell wall biosynthesis